MAANLWTSRACRLPATGLSPHLFWWHLGQDKSWDATDTKSLVKTPTYLIWMKTEKKRMLHLHINKVNEKQTISQAITKEFHQSEWNPQINIQHMSMRTDNKMIKRSRGHMHKHGQTIRLMKWTNVSRTTSRRWNKQQQQQQQKQQQQQQQQWQRKQQQEATATATTTMATTAYQTRHWQLEYPTKKGFSLRSLHTKLRLSKNSEDNWKDLTHKMR